MTASGLIPENLEARLVLVRHGETAWVAEDRFQGWQDPPLSDLGRRQAALVADRLAGEREPAGPLPPGHPIGIWSSPLARATETAQEIAARFPSVPLETSEAHREIGQGAWEGRLNSEVALSDGERLAAWRRDPTATQGPGGEPLLVAAERVRSGVAEIVRALAETRESGAWAVLVGHGGTLRLTLLTLLEIHYQRFWSFAFAPCGISVIQLAAARGSLVAHNLTDHLASLSAEPIAAAEARSEHEGAL
jgi:broad specificity phosphatase PhoE